MDAKDLFIDSKTATEILCIKMSTLYSMIHYNQIPKKVYRKFGRKLIFIKDELINWVLDGAEPSGK